MTLNFNQEFYIQSSSNLIFLLGVISECIVKDMSLLYNITEAGNYWFATDHPNYKDKLGMKESIYNLCLYYSFGLFVIIEMLTNDTLSLANNNFASKEQGVFKTAKIITKNQEHLIFHNL